MAKLKNPTTFAEAYAIDPSKLKAAGVLNPTLAADVKLFVDPLLLKSSTVPEIGGEASRMYEAHFGEVVKLLKACKEKGDPAWKAALKRFEFPEVSATCLGYGGGSIRGSGIGAKLSSRLLETARQIVDLGIDDPTLFPLLALIEEGVGADLISDMTTNVILGSLARMTSRICEELGIPTEEFEIAGEVLHLPRNVAQEHRLPVILVPRDILRPLPIAQDWSDVALAASKNATLRSRVNEHIGHLLEKATAREKERLRKQALSSREAFEALLDAVGAVPGKAYPLASDPLGLVVWAEQGPAYAREYPIAIVRPTNPSEAIGVVRLIIDQFKDLIEKNRLSRILWHEGKRRSEKTAQLLFFAIARAHCEANGIDVSPETDAGGGPVDFKFSSGFQCRVIVEIKLSSNTKTVGGYSNQIQAYRDAEGTAHAFYVVIDVGEMGKKEERLIEIRNRSREDGSEPTELIFIDGNLRPSASNL